MSLTSFLSNITDWFFTGDSESASFPYPFDIVDGIIEHSDDKTLLILARVSRYTLQRSRRFQFGSLTFSDDKRFDRFLDLIESSVSRSTVAPAVRTLHLQKLFNNPRFFTYKLRRNPRQLAEQFTGLQSLWLTSSYWHYIAPHLTEFICALPASDLQCDSMKYDEAENLVDHFQRIPLSVEHLTLYGHKMLGAPSDLSANSKAFQRKLRINTIDSTSLINLYPVWDFDTTSLGPDIIVESFHLRLSDLPLTDPQTYLSYIDKFLRYAGPRQLEKLVVDVGNPVLSKETLPYHKKISFSECSDLKALYFGTIDMNEDQEVILDTMWSLMQSLPASRISTIGLIFDAYPTVAGELDTKIQTFPWLTTVARLRQNFPALYTLKIKMGAYDLPRDGLQLLLAPVAEEIRHVESGLRVEVEAYEWSQEIYTPRLHWRNFSE